MVAEQQAVGTTLEVIPQELKKCCLLIILLLSISHSRSVNQ
jgi:hypothetical protein